VKTLERSYVVCSTADRRFDSSRRNAFYLRKRLFWFAQDTRGRGIWTRSWAWAKVWRAEKPRR